MLGSIGLFGRGRHGSSDISLAQGLSIIFCILAMTGSWVVILGLALAFK